MSDEWSQFAEEMSRNVERALEKLETPNVVNRDNALLHPWGPIGHVDEVNGRGAVEVPEFVPTHDELMQLLRYWFGVLINIEFDQFIYAYRCSQESRKEGFALRRIARVAECCGDDCVRQVRQEVADKFAKSVDAESWRIFQHGTPEEQQALQDRIQSEIGDGCRERVDEPPGEA